MERERERGGRGRVMKEYKQHFKITLMSDKFNILHMYILYLHVHVHVLTCTLHD